MDFHRTTPPFFHPIIAREFTEFQSCIPLHQKRKIKTSLVHFAKKFRKFSFMKRKNPYRPYSREDVNEQYWVWFQRNWVNLLLGAYVCFVIYTTAVPFRFHFNWHYLHNRISQINWMPFYIHGNPFARVDIVANIIFFFPLGLILALRKILNNYRLFSFKDWMGIMASGTGLSIFVEFLQIFSVTREPSITDVTTNTLGTILGALFLEVIYWRFHVGIKRWLFRWFHRKPEMIISALFLVTIFVAQSVPFTFQLSANSIRQQILELQRNFLRVEYPISGLLWNTLLYGSWSYFLFVGLSRYHRRRISAIRLMVVATLVFLVPVVLEAYQLLLPQRNHSFVDVLLGMEGILLGMILWKVRERAVQQVFYRHFPLEYHIIYFRFMSVVYFLFLVNRLLMPVAPVTHINFLSHISENQSQQIFHLVQQERLEFLIILLKEVFAFVPAGFIISFWRYRKHRRSNHILPAIGIAIGFPIIFYFLSAMLTRHEVSWFNLIAAMVGTGAGYALWQIFLTMIVNVAYEK